MSTESRVSLSRVLHGATEAYDPADMVWGATCAIIADRLVTLPFFGLEANPAVAAMGPVVWIGITVLALGGLISIWFAGELWRYRLPRWLMGTILLGHVAVVGTNLLAIAGVL